MYDIPKTAATNYIYADDIALMESGLNYAEIQHALTNDMTNLDMYFQQWRLRLNVEKTESSCFHLTNCMAKHQMEVSCGGNTIPTTPNPKYLGVTLDRSLTYAKQLQIPGFNIIAAIHHPKHGIATYARSDVPNGVVATSLSSDPLQWIAALIDGITTINVYKPPSIPFTHLPQYPHPAIYAGDFNCQHTSWGYRNDTTDESQRTVQPTSKIGWYKMGSTL